MKNRTKIVFIITAVLLVFVFAACDLLVAPIKERLNPNDPQNPIPAASDINLGLGFDEYNERTIALSWGENSYDGNEEYMLEGFVVLRKSGSASTSILDGDLVQISWGSGGGNCVDYPSYISDYPYGEIVYYSVYSFGPKWWDMDMEEQLYEYDSNGDGMSDSLGNTQNYYFTGPVTAEMASLDLNVTNDKYVISAGGFINDSLLNVESASGTAQTIVGIEFESFEVTIDELRAADLYLTKNGNSLNGLGQMEISAWNGDWDMYGDWSSVSGTPRVENFIVEVPDNSDAVMRVDVANIVSKWANGDIMYQGFCLRSDDATNVMPFSSSEVPGEEPLLRIWYMPE